MRDDLVHGPFSRSRALTQSGCGHALDEAFELPGGCSLDGKRLLVLHRLEDALRVLLRGFPHFGFRRMRPWFNRYRRLFMTGSLSEGDTSFCDRDPSKSAIVTAVSLRTASVGRHSERAHGFRIIQET